MTDRERALDPRVLAVLDLARGLLTDLDLDVVLGRVLESARELSRARYAALGVTNEARTELERQGMRSGSSPRHD